MGGYIDDFLQQSLPLMVPSVQSLPQCHHLIIWEVPVLATGEFTEPYVINIFRRHDIIPKYNV